jgi:hypothetical protein
MPEAMKNMDSRELLSCDATPDDAGSVRTIFVKNGSRISFSVWDRKFI